MDRRRQQGVAKGRKGFHGRHCIGLCVHFRDGYVMISFWRVSLMIDVGIYLVLTGYGAYAVRQFIGKEYVMIILLPFPF